MCSPRPPRKCSGSVSEPRLRGRGAPRGRHGRRGSRVRQRLAPRGRGAGGGGGQRAPRAPGEGKPRHRFPPGECRASPVGTVGGFFNPGSRNAGPRVQGSRLAPAGSGLWAGGRARPQPFGLGAAMSSSGRLGGHGGGPEVAPCLAPGALDTGRHVQILRAELGDH